jgi:hypothetical protein
MLGGETGVVPPRLHLGPPLKERDLYRKQIGKSAARHLQLLLESLAFTNFERPRSLSPHQAIVLCRLAAIKSLFSSHLRLQSDWRKPHRGYLAANVKSQSATASLWNRSNGR